jgi:hypothetical protein
MSDPLKVLFTQMDATEESTALAAMRDAGALLRGKGLGFRRVVERLEHSLLPPKIVSTLKMLDGSTHEAANAFRAARKMLKSNGLTFVAIAQALEHAGHPAEIDRLSRALTDAQAVAERNAAEAKQLRSQVSQMRTRAVLRTRSASPGRQWITIGALSLLCLWIWSPAFGGHRETAATASVAGPAWRVDSAERGPTNPSPRARCWRDRSISGQCF